MKENKIIIYKPQKGDIKLEVKLEKDTIWLDAHQLAKLFDVNRPAIVKHIGNIYRLGELFEKSTCSKMEQVAKDGKIRYMNLYNLDMIISVGYRVNSKKATQFRIWSTNVLRKYILDGYVVNNDRLLESNKLKELQTTIKFLQEKSKKKLFQGQEKEIINLLADYSNTLNILEDYDKRKIKELKGKKASFILDYNQALEVIDNIKKKIESSIFAQDNDKRLESIIKNLYQSFSGKELYNSIERKAANLLYLVIKDHPFVDGNKRTAAVLFIYFLDKNDYLYRKTGERKINDNALTALSLLVAESDSKEKNQIIALITQLLK